MILEGLLVAQLLTPGAAQYPSPPIGRHFLDAPVAQCVIARPCPFGDCVILTACPAGTQPGQLPAPPPPPVVTAPIAPTAEPKSAEPREPTVIRIEVVPMPPEKPAAKPVPKAAPKKKDCPC